jgi:hypothetical protein
LGRDTGVDWRQHEKRTAKRSGGYQQPGSGNQPGKPADVRNVKWLRENKASQSGAKGMFVKGDWLRKIIKQALTRGLNPAIELCFKGQEAPVPTDWVLVPAIEFEDLLERAGEKAIETDER